jgi:hypothetical protein
VNGDGVVNGPGRTAFDRANPSRDGSSAYRGIFGADGNRLIDARDLLAFKARLNKYRQTLNW